MTPYNKDLSAIVKKPKGKDFVPCEQKKGGFSIGAHPKVKENLQYIAREARSPIIRGKALQALRYL